MPCVLCLTTERQVACLPCGHLTSCVACGHSLKTCPLCRAPVKAFVRIYLWHDLRFCIYLNSIIFCFFECGAPKHLGYTLYVQCIELFHLESINMNLHSFEYEMVSFSDIQIRLICVYMIGRNDTTCFTIPFFETAITNKEFIRRGKRLYNKNIWG